MDIKTRLKSKPTNWLPKTSRKSCVFICRIFPFLDRFTNYQWSPPSSNFPVVLAIISLKNTLQDLDPRNDQVVSTLALPILQKSAFFWDFQAMLQELKYFSHFLYIFLCITYFQKWKQFRNFRIIALFPRDRKENLSSSIDPINSKYPKTSKNKQEI